MKISRHGLSMLSIIGAGLIVLCAGIALGADLYAPPVLVDRGIGSAASPTDIADTHLGIRYRADGALDHKGYFTTFNNPDRVFRDPGLNCSGLVVSVSRYLFEKPFTLDEVKRDRQGNSGPGSKLGEDWDFGWDLILNIAEGAHPRIMTPDGSHIPLEQANGLNTRGFDLHDRDAWERVIAQMRPGRIYLGSINKDTRKPGYKLLHYHVVLMIPDTDGNVWLYHSTQISHVHRMNIRSKKGLNRLFAQFRNRRGENKKIVIVEALLPGTQPDAAVVADSNSTHTSGAQTAGQDKIADKALSILDGIATPGADSDTSAMFASTTQGDPATDAPGPGAQVSPPVPKPPKVVINHLAGKAFLVIPDMVTHVPAFADDARTRVRFWARNRGKQPRAVVFSLKGPDGELSVEKALPGNFSDVTVTYPDDFGTDAPHAISRGKYRLDILVDGKKWCTDIFEVAEPKDAKPVITQVRAPKTVRAGQTFTLSVTAENQGAESDYGGITVSSPDPDALRLVSARPGKIFKTGSTVLSITSDKIRIKVPMAEQWIELWDENKSYEMKVRVKALKPGTHDLYVRCALRSIEVKSNVILMDPARSDTVDQQGFPVKVYSITVK